MKKRFLNILIGFDQFMQTIVYLGKYTPDETISGIIGRKIKAGKANAVEKAVCAILRKLENSHCIKSIDYDEHVDIKDF